MYSFTLSNRLRGFLTMIMSVCTAFLSFGQTYNFTNAATAGNTGPTQTQVNNAYASTSLANNVTIIGAGIQRWTVPVTGQYAITAAGAAGGYTPNAAGGKGRVITTNVTLVAGTVLDIVVGQEGGRAHFVTGYAGGGGGGSFVVNSTAGSPVLIAGGGGGAGQGNTGYVANLPGVDAPAYNITAGSNGTGFPQSWATNGVGGTNGAGGFAGLSGTYPYGGSGGGGYTGTGQQGYYGGSPGVGYASGGLGGANREVCGSMTLNIPGGFGGGAGAGICINYEANGGGGGGYSGGGGSNTRVGSGGGGGNYYTGSYVSSSLNTAPNGYVTITFLMAPGGALHFDGAGDYFPIGNINTPVSYTKEAWIYASSTTGVGRNIISSNDAPFWIENGRLSAAHGFTTGAVTLQDASAFPLNTWVHVAVTYDAATTTMKIYRNGMIVAQSASMPVHTPGSMLVGLYDGGNFFSGSMDEVRVWNRALCADEINNNRNCELLNPTTQNGLQAYYKFNQGNAGVNNTAITTAQDSGPNNLSSSSILNGFARTGTVSNFVAGYISGTCTVFNNTVAAITGYPSVCIGSTTALANATTGGTWSSSNTTVASINASGVVTGLSAGTTQINYTTACGAVASMTVTIHAKPMATVIGNSSATECPPGGSITITATSGTAPYQYSINGGSSYQSSNLFTGLGTGTYSLYINDANSCATSLGNTSLSVVTPEVNLMGNGITINKGDVSPAANDNTSFGTVNSGVSVNKTFVIQNTGSKSLDVSSILVNGANASEFTVSGISLPAVISLGSSASFSVTFVSNQTGTRNAVITVNSNDCDEAAYDFAITATTTCTAPSISNLDLYIQNPTSATACNAVVTYPLSVSGAPAPNVVYTFTGATTGTGLGTGSGQVFNKGVTNVTVQATNPCGTQNVSFTVTIVDNVKPVVLTKNINLYLNASGQATLNPADLDNGSTDNCGQISFTSSNSGIICASAAEGSSLTLQAPAGKVITSIDFASYGTPNGSCGSFTIGSCHSSSSMAAFAGAIGQNSFTISASNGIFGDPCGGTVKRLYVQATYGYSAGGNNVFGCNNLGQNTVELTVTDAEGNTETGTAIVTVIDTIKPTVNTKNIAVCLDANGNATITPAQINNGSTDNCTSVPSLTYSLDQLHFNSTHVGTNTVTLSVTDASGNTGTATATVTIQALPRQYTVIGGGAFCVGEAGVAIGLEESQNGVNYQLKRNGTNLGTAIAGTGAAISFGVQTTSGTYTVTATNATTGCVNGMNGNAVIVVNAKPVLSVSPSATAICAGGSVTLTASQNVSTTRTYNVALADLLNYQYNCNNVSYYSYAVPIGFRWIDNGYGTVTNVKIDLSVGVECHNGSAPRTTQFNGSAGPSFMPTATECSCPSSAKLRTINFTPSNYVVGGTNNFYINNTTSFGFMQNASLNNYYAVVTVTYNNGAASSGINSWSWAPGGENTASVNVSPSVTTTYTVTGTDANGCIGNASSTVTVNPLPIVYNMTGGGISGGNPIAIGLSGSQSGVRYQLMRGSTTIGTPVNGNGSAISFVPQSIAGFYSVVATNTTTNCTSNMNGAVEVIAGLAPGFINTQSAFNVTTPADACAAVVTYGLSATGIPAPAISYEFSGATTGSGSGTGSGSSFNKGLTYVTVTASNFVSSVTYHFTVTVIDNVNPVITAPAAINIVADAGQCGATVDLGIPTYSDNCGVASVTNNSASLLVNGRFPVGTTIVTWTVTDNSGLTATATQTITVTDVEDPIISLPAAISVSNDAGKCGATIVITMPVASDNCGVAGVAGVRSDALALDADYPVGSTTITWTVTDIHNRVSTATQTITVTDTEKPVISAASAISVNNDADKCNAAVSVAIPYVTDNCNVADISGVRSDALALTAPYPVGVTTITWTALDVHNNIQVSTQAVSVTDNQKPVISNLPADIVTYAINNNCATLVGWNKPTASDNCGIASFMSDNLMYEGLGLTMLSVGVHTITYTAIDIHGNKTTASFTVTVIDNQPPIITGCPGDITINAAAGKCEAVVNWNPPTASDNCPGVSLSTSHIQGAVFPVGTTQVTYTATDHVGNKTYCTFSVIVVDAEKPTIVIPSITVNNDEGACGAVVNIGTPVTADNCGVATITNNGSTNGYYPVGTTDITWIVTDVHGNSQTAMQVIKVNDTEKPVVQLKDITIQLDANGLAPVSAQDVNNGSADNCGIAGMVLSKTIFNCSNIGANMVTLTVTDIHGNVNTGNAIITVKDEIPAIVITKNITVQLNASGSASITAADVDNGSSDNCGIASMTVYPNTFNCANVGANTVTLTVTDINGNISTATAVVTVKDEVPATVITKNITVQLDASGTASITASDVDNGSSDNCGIASMTVYPNTFNCANVGANTVTLTVTDTNGNISTATAVVTVKDEVPATVITKNIAVQLDASGTASITAADVDNGSSDNCGIASMTVYPNTFNCANVGANTVTLTVTDINGNISTATAVVTVKDEVPATVITKNITVQLNASGTASITAADVDNGSSDNCGIASMTVYPNTFNCTNVGANTVTLTVTDINGNISTATAIVTVKDEVPATVITKNITVQLDASGAVSITAADVDNGSSDNCGIASINVYPGIFKCENIGDNTVVLTVTDMNGNLSTQTAIVTVKDLVAPVANLPELPMVTGQCAATVTAVPTATDACSGLITGTTNDPLHYTVQGTYTVTWKYTDAFGNISYQQQTVIVKDNIAPVPAQLSLPTVTAECSGGVTISTATACKDDCRCCRNGCHCRTGNCKCREYDYRFRGVVAYIFNLLNNYFDWNDEDHECDHDDVGDKVMTTMGAPTATDNCKGTITATTTDPLVYTTQGTHIIHWVFDDGNGNTTVQEQTIIIKDNTAPVANAPYLPVITGYCSVTVTNKPTAKDNCAGTITATTNDPLVYTVPGTYTIQWIFSDGHGNTSTQNQTVVVKDPVPPVPTNLYLPTITGNCSVTVTTVPTAKDNCDGMLTGTTNDPLTYAKAGVYTIRWSYFDGKNSIIQNQTVVVKDNMDPVPQASTLPVISGNCSVTVSTVPRANDNCAGVITATTKSPLTYTVKGIYTIVWKYDDGNGNTSTQNQTVIVSDAVAPVLTVPASMTLNCGSTSAAPSITGMAAATDNCGTPSVTYTDQVSGNLITRTWKATDPSGNYVTGVQKITMSTAFNPVITSVPTSNTFTGGVRTNLYIGYGAQSTKLEVCALPSTGAPYTYSWSGNGISRLSNTSSSAPVFSPNTAGSFTFVVTVTNKFGCSYTDNITICVTDIRVPGTNGNKVYVCHKTKSGWKTVYQTLQVSVNSVSSHLNHGSCGNNDDDDRLGSCDQLPCNTPSIAINSNNNVQTTTSETPVNTKASTTEEELKVVVMPNPTTTFFTIKLESRFETPVNLRVMDGTGRVVDARSKLGANSTLQIGHGYSSGTYYAEFIQAGRKKVVQLIKSRG